MDYSIIMMVRYIGQRDTVALDRSKIYAVLSIEKGWYRIMTELDEDYLFPPDVFEIEDEKEEWLSVVDTIVEKIR